MTDSEFVEKQHQYYKSLSKPSPTTSSQPACTQSASADINISEAEVYQLLRRINTIKSTHSSDYPSKQCRVSVPTTPPYLQ